MILFLIRWVEDDSLVDEEGSFTNWYLDQPNGGEAWDCMFMDNFDGTWYDWDCSRPFPDAVCSIHIPSSWPPTEPTIESTTGSNTDPPSEGNFHLDKTEMCFRLNL